jgi:hypothetical protein
MHLQAIRQRMVTGGHSGVSSTDNEYIGMIERIGQLFGEDFRGQAALESCVRIYWGGM